MQTLLIDWQLCTGIVKETLLLPVPALCMYLPMVLYKPAYICLVCFPQRAGEAAKMRLCLAVFAAPQ